VKKSRVPPHASACTTLRTREPGIEVMPALEELGIGLVPISAPGKGFLIGEIDAGTAFDKSDFRNSEQSHAL
jgi:aryl-alcohol dehydrogenase-like predicted oxidoreductase